MREKKSGVMFFLGSLLCLSLLLYLISFLFPVGLYPFQDFFRNSLAFVSSILLVLFVLLSASDRFSMPRHMIFSFLFMILFSLSFFFKDVSLYISYNNYIISLVLVVSVSVSISTIIERYSLSVVLDTIMRVVFFIAVLSSVLGLLRFYGVLKYFVPVIQNDGDRFLGPLGHPNLTAVSLALGVVSVGYFRFFKKSFGAIKYHISISLIFYAGSLTASRSWWLSIIIISIMFFFFLTRTERDVGSKFNFEKLAPSLLIIVFLVTFAWAAPKIDAIIVNPLIDSGFVNRISADEMFEQRISVGSSGRLSEWHKVFSGYHSIDNIWLGHGPGRYGSFSNNQELDSGRPGNGALWNHAHNIFFMFFVEWGLTGLFFILTFLSYCFWLFFKVLVCSKNNDVLIFPFTFIFVLIAHGMVEFSLWYLPFLILFISSLSVVDRSYIVNASGFLFSKIIAFSVVFTFLPILFYVYKDVYSVTKVMYSDQTEFSDMWLVGDISKSSIIGDKALAVFILKFPLMTSGVDRSLSQLDSYIDWRPLPLFMMRRASLYARFRDETEACNIITDTVKLYPQVVSQMSKEIHLLYSNLSDGAERISYFKKCAEEGVNHWLRANRNDVIVREARAALEK